MKKLLVAFLVVAAVAVLAGIIAFLVNPSDFIYRVAALAGARQELSDPVTISSPEVTWHDDYYTIEHIDDKTVAIGEPRYWQKNISYLILGSERAVLFDTGPGLRHIGDVVAGLTSLPVTVLTSHLHYDHVGGHGRFEDVALLDTPELRGQTDSEGHFRFRGEQHLGAVEDIAPPPIVVSWWLKHGDRIELGGRVLQVLATPGHTDDSMMIYDEETRQLFTGDFIYPGMLLAFLPGGHFGRYLRSAGMLIDTVAPGTVLFPAHGRSTGAWKTPRMSVKDLSILKDALLADKALKLPRSAVPRELQTGPGFSMPAPFPWDMQWDGN